jgi:hypothetical protein
LPGCVAGECWIVGHDLYVRQNYRASDNCAAMLSSTLTLLSRGRRESDRKASGGEAIFENRDSVVSPERFAFEDE